MVALSNITVKKERRLCKVNNEIGYFHCWEQYNDVIAPGITVGSNNDVIAPGITVGSHPGGQYSRMFGIVEFYDRTERIEPFKIHFVDEINNNLRSYKTVAEKE